MSPPLFVKEKSVFLTSSSTDADRHFKTAPEI